MNKTHCKTTRRCSGQYVYVGFSRCKIPRSSAYTIVEKAIRFRHPDYNPDRAQKLISSSMSRHLSTCNISSKSMHAFLSNLANRQTNRQINTGKNIHLLLCWRLTAAKLCFVSNSVNKNICVVYVTATGCNCNSFLMKFNYYHYYYASYY